MEIKKVETEKEFKQALDLRYEVFVEEQGVSKELERDDKDDEALHIIVINEEGKTVGCGRIFIEENQAKIGRMAVAKTWRNQGIGSCICHKLIQIAKKRGIDKLMLHAQYNKKGFYEKLGFEPVGTSFKEAGMKHIKMINDLNDKN